MIILENKTPNNKFNNKTNNNSIDETSKYLLLIHHLNQCRNFQKKNIIQMFSSVKEVTVLEMQRPLSPETDVVLRQRIQNLQHMCQLMVLMNNNAFIQIPNDFTLIQVMNLFIF